jgi:alkaline phosphatase
MTSVDDNLELDADYPDYLWYPEVLANVSYSSEHLARRLSAKVNSTSLNGKELKKYIKHKLVQKGLGIWDSTDDEIQLIINNTILASDYFADMVSRRAQIGWSTHGHSAVDVNIYGTAGTSHLRGNHENTDVGKFLRNYLGVKVKDITKELRDMNDFGAANNDNDKIDWMGRIPTNQEVESALRYHEKFHYIILD